MNTIPILFPALKILVIAILFALVITFVLMSLKKLGVIDYYELHRRPWMPYWCPTPCFSLWSSVAMGAVMLIYSPHDVTPLGMILVCAITSPLVAHFNR